MTTLAYRVVIDTDDTEALRRIGDPDDLTSFIAEVVADGIGPAFTSDDIPVTVTREVAT